jgi:hypothetical protein
MAEDPFDPNWEDMSSGSDNGENDDMFEVQPEEDDDGEANDANPMNMLARLLGVIGGR